MNENVKEGAKNNAHGGTIDAKHGSEEEDAKDGAEVIKDRGDGGDKEAAVGLDDAGEEGTEGKEELAYEHDAHKVGHKLGLRSGEVSNGARDGGSEDKKEGGNTKKKEIEKI